MYKTMDYLEWRGDLSFTKDPVNDVDALIFALLSYLPLKGIVPGIDSGEEISLKDTAEQYFASVTDKKNLVPEFNPTASTTFDGQLVELLKTTSNCPRFENVKLSNFDENTDFAIGRQFGAVTFTLTNPGRDKVVAFRGTDNSLIGWKEDFELAYMEQTPAQESALKYLENAIGLFSSQFIVCGHSKGGNLAVYSGSRVNPMRMGKIVKILNFDGPGFDFSVTRKVSFARCTRLVTNYIPEESMVGLLLENVGKRIVVQSEGRFIYQHAALNWGVERNGFLQGTLSSTAKLLEQTLNTWVNNIYISERAMFLEALFDILGASEGKAIKFSPQESLREIKRILVKYSKLDSKTKVLLTQVFTSLTDETRKTITATIKDKLPKRSQPISEEL